MRKSLTALTLPVLSLAALSSLADIPATKAPIMAPATVTCHNQVCDFGAFANYIATTEDRTTRPDGVYTFTEADTKSSATSKLPATKYPVELTYTSGTNSFRVLLIQSSPDKSIAIDSSSKQWYLKSDKGEWYYLCIPDATHKSCPISAAPFTGKASSSNDYTIKLVNETPAPISVYAITSSDSPNWNSHNFTYTRVQPGNANNPQAIGYADLDDQTPGEQTADYAFRLHLDDACQTDTVPYTYGNANDVIIKFDNTGVAELTPLTANFVCGNQKYTIDMTTDSQCNSGGDSCTIYVKPTS